MRLNKEELTLLLETNLIVSISRSHKFGLVVGLINTSNGLCVSIEDVSI